MAHLHCKHSCGHHGQRTQSLYHIQQHSSRRLIAFIHAVSCKLSLELQGVNFWEEEQFINCILWPSLCKWKMFLDIFYTTEFQSKWTYSIPHVYMGCMLKYFSELIPEYQSSLLYQHQIHPFTVDEHPKKNCRCNSELQVSCMKFAWNKQFDFVFWETALMIKYLCAFPGLTVHCKLRH